MAFARAGRCGFRRRTGNGRARLAVSQRRCAGLPTESSLPVTGCDPRQRPATQEVLALKRRAEGQKMSADPASDLAPDSTVHPSPLLPLTTGPVCWWWRAPLHCCCRLSRPGGRRCCVGAAARIADADPRSVRRLADCDGFGNAPWFQTSASLSGRVAHEAMQQTAAG